MPLFALTVFLASLLLFQVQPLICKRILPWFGGTPSVWTACVMFFQVLLLAGYLYAHTITSRLKPRAQWGCHTLLLLASLLALPIIPAESWQSGFTENATWYVLALLTTTVGAPFFVLSTTAPLLQSWVVKLAPTRSPYPLYAVSNAGGLLGLFLYPLIVERFLTLTTQAWLWSAVYLAFVALCLLCGWRMAIKASPEDLSEAPDATNSGDDSQTINSFDLSSWVLLSGVGSLMLLATTNLMCQDIASVPFLWVVPLALYLISFIVCFAWPSFYRRSVFAVLLGLACVLLVPLHCRIFDAMPELLTYSLTLIACCFICHGELVARKPHPRSLTKFYLAISTGGALGGVFVATVAPVLFDGFFEFYLGLAACIFLLWLPRLKQRLTVSRLRPKLLLTAVVLSFLLGPWVVNRTVRFVGGLMGIVEMQRNFYGFVMIQEFDQSNPDSAHVTMLHGTTFHGYQFQSASLRETPTSYYAAESGLSYAILHHPKRPKPLKIGVVGLGCGTIACYGKTGDQLAFYEIDPKIAALAESHFSFLSDARHKGVAIDILLGDARIVMDRQLERGQGQAFDLLVVDAFSSDSIPVHLLTRECFKIYSQHLAPNGILAVHVSNRTLDLAPVVTAGAAMLDMEAIFFSQEPPSPPKGATRGMASSNEWVIVTANQIFTRHPMISRVGVTLPMDRNILWTDDFNSLIDVVR